MAAAHVAGLAAYFVSIYPLGFSASDLDDLYLARTRPLDSQMPLVHPKNAFNPLETELTPAVLKRALLKFASKGKLLRVRL